MRKANPRILINAALEARKRAVAPYSLFQVGAALRTKSGRIIRGANVESVSYGLTCCAERVALFKALTDGESEFEAMAIVARSRHGPMPCGACRQLLAEYAPKARIWVADSDRPGQVREWRVADLLPNAFLKVPSVPASPAEQTGRRLRKAPKRWSPVLPESRMS